MMAYGHAPKGAGSFWLVLLFGAAPVNITYSWVKYHTSGIIPKPQ